MVLKKQKEAGALMFTRSWSTSKRKYDVTVERDVKVRMPDGTALDGDIYRPASSERFPVILGRRFLAGAFLVDVGQKYLLRK